ncbi:MAG: hypothetical protein RIQ79_49, partial [Verrucomicrobiota bacterium]
MKRVFLFCSVLIACAVRLLAQSSVPVVTSPPSALTLVVGDAASSVDLTTIFSVPGVTGQVVQFDTSFGKFNVELLASAAPNHVTNFLAYVNAGDYTDTCFHRVASFEGTAAGPSILQGGGYKTAADLAAITKRAPVNLEYNLPNARGTLAAARTSDVNSATNEWFFNTRDNSTILGPTNASGYTVFARVIGTGMTIVDTIAAKPLYNLGGAFATAPLRDVAVGQTSLLVANLINVNGTSVVPLFPSASSQAAVVTFTVSSNLPSVATASLTAGKTLAVTPVGAGTATLTLTATDTNGNQAQTTVSVTVTSNTHSDRQATFTLGSADTLSLALPGYSQWSATNLPAWLTLDASTGVLSGTPPTDASAFNFSLQALDANSVPLTQSVTLLLQAPADTDFVFSSDDFTEALVGRTLAGFTFTSATGFEDPSEAADSVFRTGTWTYSATAANQARITLTYPTADPLSREGIDLVHRAALSTDALRFDLDADNVASGHQLTSADLRTAFAPRDVAAAKSGTRDVTVTWRNEGWTDGYRVYRTASTTPPAAGATPLNGATDLLDSTYTDTAPPRGSALTYWVTAVRAGQETAPASASITIRDVPLVLSQPTTVMAALNSTQLFDVTTLGTGLTYQWYFKGKPVLRATKEDLSVRATAAAAGVYTLRIKDNDGDTAQADVNLIVVSAPRLTVQPAVRLSLILGGGTRLSATATGLALDYQWFFNGQPLSGETNSYIDLTNVTPANQGKYTVRVHNIAGAVTSRGTTLTVLIPPTIQSVSGPATVVLGQPFTLTAAASGT